MKTPIYAAPTLKDLSKLLNLRICSGNVRILSDYVVPFFHLHEIGELTLCTVMILGLSGPLDIFTRLFEIKICFQ